MAFAASLRGLRTTPAVSFSHSKLAVVDRSQALTARSLTTASSSASIDRSNQLLGRLTAGKKSFLSGTYTLSSQAGSWQGAAATQVGARKQSTMASGDKPIQLYSLATPNGQKIGIFLEEAKILYEAHLIDIGKGDQFKPEFVKINPNSKIPAIVDPNGPGGKEIRVFESGAIMIYLAEKYKSPLYPTDPEKRAEALGWLFWQVGGLGPMLGQTGHFYNAAKEDVPYAKERYRTESKRLMTVLDKALEGKEYLAGDYSIADIACVPWVKGLSRYKKEVLDIDDFPNAKAWVDRIFARPQVQKGVTVNARQ